MWETAGCRDGSTAAAGAPTESYPRPIAPRAHITAHLQFQTIDAQPCGLDKLLALAKEVGGLDNLVAMANDIGVAKVRE